MTPLASNHLLILVGQCVALVTLEAKPPTNWHVFYEFIRFNRPLSAYEPNTTWASNCIAIYLLSPGSVPFSLTNDPDSSGSGV